MTFSSHSYQAPAATLAALLFAIPLLGCNRDTDHRLPTASQILDRMATTYSECDTYSDSGTLTTTYLSSEGERVEVKPFSTAMIRPHQFRFQFRIEGDSQSRYIVWRDGTQIRTWWDVKRRSERPYSLGLGLAGATGVSGGAAHTIPALLLPREVGGRTLTDATKARRGADQLHGEHACFTIEAQLFGSPITIWIDQQSYLVRRIDTRAEYEHFTTQDTTIIDPVVNETVQPSLLKFGAPW
jgi:outer membrane lipoprotein-sorting protein